MIGQSMVKNPLPSLGSLKEFYASTASNLMSQLIFNPYVNPYTLGGNRSVFMEAFMCTVLTTLITIPGIAKSLAIAHNAHELAGDIPESRLLQRLPRNRWVLASLTAVLLAPLGGLLFAFVFKFYGFSSWTFYQLFAAKLAYQTVLGKLLVAFSIRRFTQPNPHTHRTVSF